LFAFSVSLLVFSVSYFFGGIFRLFSLFFCYFNFNFLKFFFFFLLLLFFFFFFFSFSGHFLDARVATGSPHTSRPPTTLPCPLPPQINGQIKSPEFYPTTLSYYRKVFDIKKTPLFVAKKERKKERKKEEEEIN